MVQCGHMYSTNGTVCGTSSLKLREENRLSLFKNRVLRRIVGTKRDEATGG